MATDTPKTTVEEPLDLKDPVMAGFLAWLIPGLGHWYQGRRAKAVLYFVCIMGLFSYGVYLGGSDQKCLNGNGIVGYGRAVYFSWRPGDQRLLPHYLCQVGVGLPALPALVQASRMSNHRKVFWGGFMAPPRLPSPSGNDREDPNFDQPTPHDLHFLLNRYFELAGFFTMVAGLLNVLAIYDACAGPVPAPVEAKKEEEGQHV
jgi:hypothetical protein